MRTRLMRSKFTLFFIVCAVLIAVPGAAALAQDTGTSPAPTIQSDLPDYAPGDTVTLTGSGWQPGEVVHINVNDDQTQAWSRDVDVTADASGNITDQFQLPTTFAAVYKVTVTGPTSGTATTTFTDGNMRFRTTSLSGSGNVQFPVTWTKYLNNATCQVMGPAANRTTGTGNVVQNFGSGSLQVDVPAGQSMSFTAPSPEDLQTFKKWTGPADTFSTSGTNGQTICVFGSNNGQDFTANYSTDNTAPSVTLTQVNGSTRTFPYSTNQDVTSVGGSCTAGDGLVSVTRDGNATSPATATCSSTGSWSLTLSPSLSAGGTYAFAATQTDASFNTGSSGNQSVTIDKTAPSVTSIVKADTDPTNANSVSWTVTFSKSVTGVNIGTNSDFALVSSSGISGASITNLSGSGTTYTVTANTGSGNGTLGLNLVDDDTIVDAASNKLGGTGAGNGNFTGQTYTINKDTTAPTSTHSLSSAANANGWNNQNVTVTLNATDNTGGSGVKEIRYSINGGTNAVYDSANKPVISTEGTTTFTYFAVDNNSNAES